MMNFTLVKGTLAKTVSLIVLIGVVWLLLTRAVTGKVTITRGTAQQLEGVVSRNWSEWPWGVGGAAVDLADSPEYNSVYELTNHSDLELEIKPNSQDWFHLNRGDGSNGLVKTAIIRF